MWDQPTSALFTLRTTEGFVENFGPNLIARVGKEAPGVRLRFVPKPDRDSAPVCTENLIRFDCVTESLNVSDDGRLAMLLSDAAGLSNTPGLSFRHTDLVPAENA